MNEPIYKIQDLRKVFGVHVVLDKINLELMSGEILGIIGSSGSGKTTLLNTVIGFLRPERGDIKFRMSRGIHEGEESVYESVYKNEVQVKRIYGFASQTPSFYEKLTVRENLEYFGSLYNLSKEAISVNAETLLRLMNLKNSEGMLAKNLSGGMERRLDIACAMMHDPDVLILDEPTADLDPVLRGHIWELVKKINRKGTSILLASHHLTELENLCTRIAILKDGLVLAVGQPEALKDKFSEHQEIHIESFPGNYDKLMKAFLEEYGHRYITRVVNKGAELVIYTTKPEKILHELLHKTEDLKENVIGIRVSKATLDEIFISLFEKKNNPTK
jgi:ABC-2 type transport system ATP-binding protein